MGHFIRVCGLVGFVLHQLNRQKLERQRCERLEQEKQEQGSDLQSQPLQESGVGTEQIR